MSGFLIVAQMLHTKIHLEERNHQPWHFQVDISSLRLDTWTAQNTVPGQILFDVLDGVENLGSEFLGSEAQEDDR